MSILVRNTRPRDYPAIAGLSRTIYPKDDPWTFEQLDTHRDLFPEGQFVAVDAETDEVVGMAASLIITWDDYEHVDTYNDFTDDGWFTNHDPTGRTLYGAEVMVDRSRRGEGIGTKIYEARKELARRLELLRIRAGARLVNYGDHADEMSAREYVRKVISGDLFDTALSFQIRHGFRVLGIVSDYLDRDPRSRGYAAIIEWLNEEMADEVDLRRVETFH